MKLLDKFALKVKQSHCNHVICFIKNILNSETGKRDRRSLWKCCKCDKSFIMQDYRMQSLEDKE